jgi:hypothetical protein
VTAASAYHKKICPIFLTVFIGVRRVELNRETA